MWAGIGGVLPLSDSAGPDNVNSTVDGIVVEPLQNLGGMGGGQPKLFQRGEGISANGASGAQGDGVISDCVPCLLENVDELSMLLLFLHELDSVVCVRAVANLYYFKL